MVCAACRQRGKVVCSISTPLSDVLAQGLNSQAQAHAPGRSRVSEMCGPPLYFDPASWHTGKLVLKVGVVDHDVWLINVLLLCSDVVQVVVAMLTRCVCLHQRTSDVHSCCG